MSILATSNISLRGVSTISLPRFWFGWHKHLTHICILQREISNAADIAARLYREATPEDRRSAPEIWDTMTKAQEKLIKNIRSRNFEKYISVAHKDNGEDFFLEVPP